VSPGLLRPLHRPLARSTQFAGLLSLLLTAILLAACGGGDGPVSADAAGDGIGALSGKNLLLVTIDTLRADRLGSYGDAAAHTPHLDALAAGGVRFADAYSPVPLTLPAHSVMFTGRHPFTTGVRVNGIHYLGDAERTLAERFQDAGYATGATISAYVMVSKFGLAQGFDSYEDSLTMDNVYRFYAEIPADVAVGRFTTWLDRRGYVAGRGPEGEGTDAAGSGDEPFFAWLHLYDPHQPYEPPGEWAERFADDPYRGEIAFVDQQVGRLVEELKRRGLAGETAVVVTSDHGEAFGEHGEWGHGLLAYDETLRVPLIVHAPGPLASGRVVEDRVSLYDLFPTLTGLFGLEDAPVVPGRNLWGVLRPGGAAPLEPAPVYFETLAGQEKGWAPLTGIIDGDHKYIDVPEPELYDLAVDPGETENLLTPPAVLAAGGPGAGAEAANAPDRRAGDAGGTGESGQADQSGEAGEAGEAGEGDPARAAARRLDQALRRARSLDRQLAELVETDPGDVGESTRELSEEDRRQLTALGYVGGSTAAKRSGASGDDSDATLDPKLAIELENRGREVRNLVDEGKPGQAASRLAQVRQAHPDVDLADFYDLEFLIAKTAGNQEAAVAALTRGVQAFPDFASLELRLATYLHEIGRLEPAEAHARSLLEDDPRNSQAMSLLGLVAQQQGDMEAARRHFQAALELEPTSVPLRVRVAELAIQQGDRESARALYDQLLLEGALDAQPDELARSAMLDAAMGNLERAESTLRRVVDMAPTGMNHFSLAMVLTRRGNRDGAIEHLEAALEASEPLEPAPRALAQATLNQMRGGQG